MAEPYTAFTTTGEQDLPTYVEGMDWRYARAHESLPSMTHGMVDWQGGDSVVDWTHNPFPTGYSALPTIFEGPSPYQAHEFPLTEPELNSFTA